MSYSIIDKTKLISEIYCDDSFASVVHEFVSMIDDYLSLLVRVGNPVEVSDLFNHFLIIKKKPGKGRYIYIKDIIRFDIDRLLFVSTTGILYEIPFAEIKKSIENNIAVLRKTKLIEPNIRNLKQLNTTIRSCELEDITEIDKTVAELKSNVQTMKKKYGNDIEQLSCQLQKDKNELKHKKDLEDEKRRKFEANKVVYFRIKQDIQNGKIDEDNIPVLFVDDYPIFKFLDTEGLIDKDDNFLIYMDLIEKDKTDSDIPIQNSYNELFSSSPLCAQTQNDGDDSDIENDLDIPGDNATQLSTNTKLGESKIDQIKNIINNIEIV